MDAHKHDQIGDKMGYQWGYDIHICCIYIYIYVYVYQIYNITDICI